MQNKPWSTSHRYLGSSRNWLYGHVDALQKFAHFISRAGLQVGQKIGKQECQQHKKHQFLILLTYL